MYKTTWIFDVSVACRIVLAVLLAGTMIVATRFGWRSPHFQIPGSLRLTIVVMTAFSLTSLAWSFSKRSKILELLVVFAIFTLIGLLLIPAVNGHTGKPSSGESFLWRKLVWVKI
jgi:hypothetical protein